MENNRNTEFPDWSTKDQIVFGTTVIFLFLALAAGMANVVAMMLASDPVFIENPWLAILIATVVPTICVCVKHISSFIDSDQNRRQYGKCVFILTAIAAVIWIYQFSQTYTGAGGEIDWGSIGDSETNNHASYFVASQILLEVLLASALALGAEDIYLRYYPNKFTQSEELAQIDMALSKQYLVHEVWQNKLCEVEGELVELEAAKQSFINQRIVDYIAERSLHQMRLQAHAEII